LEEFIRRWISARYQDGRNVGTSLKKYFSWNVFEGWKEWTALKYNFSVARVFFLSSLFPHLYLSFFYHLLIWMSLLSLPFPSLSLFYLTFFCVSLFSVQTSISFVICLLSRTLIPYCVFHYLSSVFPFLMWVSSATHNLDKYCCKVHTHTHTRAYVVFLTC
jgi:hypothetical protein